MNKQETKKIIREELNLILESVMRDCTFILADNNKWYMALEDTTRTNTYYYGPFKSLDEAEEYLGDYFANPGGSYVDKSGEAKSRDIEKHRNFEDRKEERGRRY